LIPESVKRELVDSLIIPLTFAVGGRTYEVENRRQDQARRVEVPSLVIFFSREIPIEQFLGGRIGTYTDSESNEIELHGWREHDEIHFYAYARDDPKTGEANGLPLVDSICHRALDHILNHWDRDILFANGMSLEEDIAYLPVPTYINDFLGPEYSHAKKFTLRINTQRYYPTFESPSINTTVIQLEFGLKETGDEYDPVEFVVPTNEYNG